MKNSQNDINKFESYTYKQQKIKLKHLTDTIYSLVQNKYDESKSENIIQTLEKRAKEFNKNLHEFYNKNKKNLKKEELKKALINYINIYRYSEGSGYFFLSDFNYNILVHPTSPEFNNTNHEHMKSKAGIYVLKTLSDEVKEKGNASLHYKWLNPKSKNIEEKLAYSFIFKPYKWIITTGEYKEVLTKRLKNEVFDLIAKIRYSNKNYFFITNYNNVMLSHPYYKGRDFSNILDKDGNLLIPELIKKTRKQSESFTSYYWSKDNEYSNPLKKFTYSRDFPPWKIIISTGFYIDEVQKELKLRKIEIMKQLREIVMHTKLGKTGYLYIFNKKGKMLIHPNQNLDGNENFHTLLDPSGKNIYKQLVKAASKESRSYTYKWDKPEDKNNYIYEKISWVEYIPELDWYIGSSVYTNEFKISADEVKYYIFKITFIVLFLSLFYSLIFFRNLLKPINLLSNLVSSVSKGNYSARSPYTKQRDEISILSNKFNDMLDTIEEKNLQLEDSNNELEEMIENLKKTQNRLIESEKMASLGGLVAGIAHEINTPIGVGLTASTHLSDLSKDISKEYKNETMSQNDFEAYLRTSQELSSLIENNLAKTAKLIKSFKQIAADQSEDEKKEFNLKEYCDEVLISINSIVKQTSLSLSISCENDILINSYPGAFSHIISNLITNSIKHGFDANEKGHMHFDISLKETYVQILYKDNGKGIPKENYQKVFEPFFTTNRKDGGAGLGLNIIYNIIQKSLKGNITCEPCKKGVLFKIIIPL